MIQPLKLANCLGDQQHQFCCNASPATTNAITKPPMLPPRRPSPTHNPLHSPAATAAAAAAGPPRLSPSLAAGCCTWEDTMLNIIEHIVNCYLQSNCSSEQLALIKTASGLSQLHSHQRAACKAHSWHPPAVAYYRDVGGSR